MIQPIVNILTNQSFVNCAQNTKAAIGIETTLKAIGRPTFIYLDKDIDKNTKNYAAVKEFLYQVICLAVYLALVIPFFKGQSFKLAKNFILKHKDNFYHLANKENQKMSFKHTSEFAEAKDTYIKNTEKDKKFFDALKNMPMKQYLNYHSFTEKIEGLGEKERAKILSGKSFDELPEFFKNELKTTTDPIKYKFIKGYIEVGSIIGSIIGLTILAPQVSHFVIHPLLNFLSPVLKHFGMAPGENNAKH